MRKFLMLRKEYSGKRVVKVVYTMWTSEDAKEEAKGRKYG